MADKNFEFKSGDIVMQIGGSVKFVISGVYETTSWISVQHYDTGVTHDMEKIDLEQNYVKVGNWDWRRGREIVEGDDEE